MKRLKLQHKYKLNNLINQQEARDEIWDYMASKWAAKAERLSSYGRTHLPKPVKSAIKTTIQRPINATKSIRAKREASASNSPMNLRFSNAGK